MDARLHMGRRARWRNECGPGVAVDGGLDPGHQGAGVEVGVTGCNPCDEPVMALQVADWQWYQEQNPRWGG